MILIPHHTHTVLGHSKYRRPNRRISQFCGYSKIMRGAVYAHKIVGYMTVIALEGRKVERWPDSSDVMVAAPRASYTVGRVID